MTQLNLFDKEVENMEICDNVDCECEKVFCETKRVQMKEEFEGGFVNWCPECIERDKEFVVMCEYCDSFDANPIVVYQPFNNEPSFEGYLCYGCREDFIYCETCGREIYRNNGYRNNVRYDNETNEIICVKCLQAEWFISGMDLFKDGDWFNDSDLLSYGFIKHRSYFCRADLDCKNAEKDFIKLQGAGNLVIVCIERSGMGLEYYFSIWIKQNA